MNAATAPAGSPWQRRILHATIAFVVLTTIVAVLGFLVVPRFVKAKIEAYATEVTGRKASLGNVEFNPFTLRGTLTDFTLSHHASEQSLFHFDALDVEVSPATLWRRAPVLNAIRLTRPTIALGRNADGTYDIQDLIDAWAKPSADPTPQFSLNNIEIEGGAVSLDDRMRKNKVALANLAIGIPFLSSLPHDAAIRVNPRLEGVVEGARFMLKGTTSTPFAERKEATLDIDLDALALMEIAQYVPLPHGLKLKDGALTTRLKLAFVSEKGEPRAVTLSGAARLDRLAITRSDDSLLIGARTVVTSLGKLDPLGRAIVLDGVTIEAPEIDLKRGSDGAFELQRLFRPTTAPQGSVAAPAPARPAPWMYSIAELHVTDGKVRVADEAVSPAFRVALANVAVDGRKVSSSGDPGAVEVAFDSEAGAHFGGTVNLDIAKSAARGQFSLTKFRLAELYPYYASALNLDVRRGELDLTADFDTEWSGTSLQLTLAQGRAMLADMELAVRGERDPLWRVPKSDLSGIAFDLAKHAVSIDRLEARPLSLRIVRHADGDVNFERLLRKSARAASDTTSAPQSDADWNVVVRKLLLERLSADFEDQVAQPPVKLSIPEARIAAENMGNARGTKGTIEFTARVGPAGRARAAGVMATRPFAIDWKVDVTRVDLLPLRPYFEAQTNVIVTSGALTADGRLTYGGATPSGPAATFKGNTTLSDFGALDRPTSQELVRWKTLTVSGVDVIGTPRKVALGAIALDEFYARLIVNPDASINLQRLFVPTASAAAKTGEEAAVSIGDIKVSRGDVQFSDFYIKPNYSAHLTDVVGSVSALSRTQAGKVDVTARVGNLAPVEVHGTVNPFAQALTLELTGKATGVDLPPLSAYSGKYAGYGITKGSLSFEVQYKIDNRRLTASNKLVLDQLTFGERVESPTATKLPVLLAVALLKDGNGTIRLDLPVQGSLDDPEFSVFGVVVQIIVNLITKAVTAPFALIAAIAGSHGDELAFVEFLPGRAELSPSTEAKLQTLAKGLADRPALKLDIAGRAVPDADREGLKHAALERAMRAQKQKALIAKGDAAPSLAALTIDAAERPELLAAVYRDADLKDKPRNVIGFAKDIPPAEMESLLLKSYGVDDEALRALANERSENVKEWFTGKGGIASERMFIVAPKLTADGIPDKGAPTRVDFAIR